MDTLKFPIYTKHNDFTFVMQLSKHRALVAQGSESMPYGTFEVNVEPAVHHYFTEYDEGKAIEITRVDFKIRFIMASAEILKLLYDTESKPDFESGGIKTIGGPNLFNLGNIFEPEILKITDPRDIAEITRRKELKLFQPPKEELYTFNPDFDGKYTNLDNDGK